MVDIAVAKEHMYDVVGAIYEVHKELGPGLNEYCYQEGLQMELEDNNIPCGRELTFHPSYHGKPMNAEYSIDFLCKEDIIVECKAVTELVPSHRAQLFNYMRLLRKPYGILVNFSPKFATIERYINDIENNTIMGLDGQIIK